jgi:hypothetical protein
MAETAITAYATRHSTSAGRELRTQPLPATPPGNLNCRPLSDLTAEPNEVLKFLVERSGLIRTPSEGRIDFIHRSFQEYLAGKAAIDNDEIGYLLEHSTDDQFRAVIVMAVGHALPWQADEFLRGLITQSAAASDASDAKSQKTSHQLNLLAIACLQTVRRIDPALREVIEGIAQNLLPPESFDVAPVLAATGPIVLDLMAERPPATPPQAAASIRVASLVGGRDAMLLISDIAGQFDEIEDEVIRAWTEFDLSEYSSTVIPRMRWSGRLTVTDHSLLPYLSNMIGLTELTVPAKVMTAPTFPRRPQSVRFLRTADNALAALKTLQGWDDLTSLEIYLNVLSLKLNVLRKFEDLECLRVVSSHSGVLDLTPLSKLLKLRVIHLVTPEAKLIRLNPLSEMKDLSIYVPPKVAIVGRETLKKDLE